MSKAIATISAAAVQGFASSLRAAMKGDREDSVSLSLASLASAVQSNGGHLVVVDRLAHDILADWHAMACQRAEKNGKARPKADATPRASSLQGRVILTLQAIRADHKAGEHKREDWPLRVQSFFLASAPERKAPSARQERVDYKARCAGLEEELATLKAAYAALQAKHAALQATKKAARQAETA